MTLTNQLMSQHDWIPATGDVGAGDVIRFSEACFGGSWEKPRYAGDREIVAIVSKDSYGSTKQQHTFTLQIVDWVGDENPGDPGEAIRRKGRNVYRNGCERLAWQDETARDLARSEKHERGSEARGARFSRKNGALAS